jgi:hypothetical protein
VDFLAVIQQYGPLTGAIVFFMWRDWKREDRLSKRIDTLENEQRKIILPLVEKSTSVIARNTSVMERLEAALERKLDDLQP